MSGNTRLAMLELEVSRSDRLTDFSPTWFRYAVATTSETAIVRARAEDPAAQLTYHYWQGEALLQVGELGTGSGDVTLSLPLGLGAIRVYVRPPGGAYRYYEIQVNRSPEWPCNEQGVRGAIASSKRGPQTFDCDGPTTVVTQAEIVVDDDAILDGEGDLTLEGDDRHRIFFIPAGRTVELVGMDLANGEAESGGGIYNLGSAMLVDSRVGSNRAELRGGGIYSGPGSELFLDGVAVTDNLAAGSSEAAGGGLYLEDSATFIADSLVGGNVALGRSGQSGRRGRGGGLFVTGGELIVETSRIAANSAMGGDASVDPNTAGSAGGGGLHLEHSTARILDTAVSSNQCLGGYAYRGGGFASGGGIWMNGGALTIEGTTIESNLADGISGPWEAGSGGGLLVGSGARFVAVNSTLSGNRADYDEAMTVGLEASAAFYNSTIAFNSTDESHSALGIRSDSEVTLGHTIVANQGRCAGSVRSLGYNLFAPNFGCRIEGSAIGDVIGVDPELHPLSDNGGPTMTHALSDTSPALDAGDPSGCVGEDGRPLTRDQRGWARPVETCDIGAFERE